MGGGRGPGCKVNSAESQTVIYSIKKREKIRAPHLNSQPMGKKTAEEQSDNQDVHVQLDPQD